MEWILILVIMLAVILFWHTLKNRFGDPDQIDNSFYDENSFEENKDEENDK